MVFFKLKVILHVAKNYSKYRDVAALAALSWRVFWGGGVLKAFAPSPLNYALCAYTKKYSAIAAPLSMEVLFK